MTIVDNETLQPDKPPTPKLVSKPCPSCGGTGKAHRVYRGRDGKPINVTGRCLLCLGHKIITMEACNP